MTTRRQTLRRSLRLPLSLGRRLPALSADVSRGGFQAELPQVFLPGSKVHGFFLVGDREVGFTGTVAWAEAGNPQLSLYSRIGVSFDALPEALDVLLSAQDRRPKKLKARVKK
ncbi:MAG TPA: PilZ domain-containing protein [Archangium sp.]